MKIPKNPKREVDKMRRQCKHMFRLQGYGMRVLIFSLAAVFVSLTVGGCEQDQDARAIPGWVDDERLRKVAGEPGSWLTVGRDFGETHYSPLRQINDHNADQLGFAWQYFTNTHRGLEATPIFVDGVLYVTGNWGLVHQGLR